MLSPVSPPVSGRSNAPEIEPRSISEHDLYATATSGEAPISAACIGSFQIGSDRASAPATNPVRSVAKRSPHGWSEAALVIVVRNWADKWEP
jgi:hypothetical protein